MGYLTLSGQLDIGMSDTWPERSLARELQLTHAWLTGVVAIPVIFQTNVYNTSPSKTGLTAQRGTCSKVAELSRMRSKMLDPLSREHILHSPLI